MLIRKSFRYRIYPTPAQVSRFAAWGDALRFLWNLAHEQRLLGLARSKGEKRYYTAFDQQLELKGLRAELPWLDDVPQDVCSQLLVKLDMAWRQCFKKLARTPRWKRRSKDDSPSLCEPHPRKWRLDGDVIRFPKIGNLRAVIHRPLEGTPKTCTVKRDGDQWFASISCEVEIADPVLRSEPVVAIDRGIVNLIADSDGRLIESPRFYTRAMSRLACAQRSVSRKQKGSKNREKAKLRVARIHRKVRRQREHLVQTLSAMYTKSHGVVGVEKLQIDRMVQQKKCGLSRGILDSGWGLFAECLRYKLAWSGGTLVEVPAAYSSQTCSECGCIDSKSRRSQSEFVCTACGFRDHADLNAAKVLKQRVNRSLMPVEGKLDRSTLRNRKELRVVRRSTQSSVL